MGNSLPRGRAGRGKPAVLHEPFGELRRVADGRLQSLKNAACHSVPGSSFLPEPVHRADPFGLARGSRLFGILPITLLIDLHLLGRDRRGTRLTPPTPRTEQLPSRRRLLNL